MFDAEILRFFHRFVISTRRFPVKPVDIPVNLPQVVQASERQRIEVDLRVSLKRQRESISDRVQSGIRLGFEGGRLSFIKTIPLLVVLHFEQLRTLLLDNC